MYDIKKLTMRKTILLFVSCVFLQTTCPIGAHESGVPEKIDAILVNHDALSSEARLVVRNMYDLQHEGYATESLRFIIDSLDIYNEHHHAAMFRLHPARLAILNIYAARAHRIVSESEGTPDFRQARALTNTARRLVDRQAFPKIWALSNLYHGYYGVLHAARESNMFRLRRAMKVIGEAYDFAEAEEFELIHAKAKDFFKTGEQHQYRIEKLPKHIDKTIVDLRQRLNRIDPTTPADVWHNHHARLADALFTRGKDPLNRRDMLDSATHYQTLLDNQRSNLSGNNFYQVSFALGLARQYAGMMSADLDQLLLAEKQFHETMQISQKLESPIHDILALSALVSAQRMINSRQPGLIAVEPTIRLIGQQLDKLSRETQKAERLSLHYVLGFAYNNDRAIDLTEPELLKALKHLRASISDDYSSRDLAAYVEIGDVLRRIAEVSGNDVWLKQAKRTLGKVHRRRTSLDNELQQSELSVKHARTYMAEASFAQKAYPLSLARVHLDEARSVVSDTPYELQMTAKLERLESDIEALESAMTDTTNSNN